jgi:hypothetical protein
MDIIVFFTVVIGVLVFALWRKTRAEIREGLPDGGDAGSGPNDQPDPLRVGDESYTPNHGYGGPIVPLGPGIGGGGGH